MSHYFVNGNKIELILGRMVPMYSAIAGAKALHRMKLPGPLNGYELREGRSEVL